MAIPPLKDAESLQGDEVFIGIQGGRLKRFAVSLLRGLKGDTGPGGSSGKDGISGPAGPKGDTGATGPAGSIGPKGDTGPAGTPKRVERYTSVTNASGVATFTFSPAFAATPDIDIIETWSGDQLVGGGVLTSSATGCTVQAMVSRGTLLLTAGPFTKAGAGVSVTVRAIGN